MQLSLWDLSVAEAGTGSLCEGGESVYRGNEGTGYLTFYLVKDLRFVANYTLDFGGFET